MSGKVRSLTAQTALALNLTLQLPAPQNLGTERQLSGMRVVQAGGTSREHQICRMTLACVVRYAGSQFNILNVILVVSVLTPLLGIAFALWSYGTLWG